MQAKNGPSEIRHSRRMPKMLKPLGNLSASPKLEEDLYVCPIRMFFFSNLKALRETREYQQLY